MLKVERHRRILQIVRESGYARVAEMSSLLGVSEATIRRDLEILEQQKAISRTHGGAIVVEPTLPEAPILQRMDEQRAAKRRIGQVAAALVKDGETIFIGSGTTTLEVARNLVDRRELTVVTNALNVADVLAERPSITVVVTGGMLRHSELSLIGHFTDQALQELRLDKVFLGIRAIAVEHGLTNDYLPEVMTDRTIVRMGQEVIVVADHTKFGKSSTVLLCPVNAVTTIVTDEGVPEEIVRAIEELGVKVLIA